jgi:hypothetical protein
MEPPDVPILNDIDYAIAVAMCARHFLDSVNCSRTVTGWALLVDLDHTP